MDLGRNPENQNSKRYFQRNHENQNLVLDFQDFERDRELHLT